MGEVFSKQLFVFVLSAVVLVVLFLAVGIAGNNISFDSSDNKENDDSGNDVITGFAVHPLYPSFSLPESGFVFNNNTRLVSISDTAVYKTGYYSINGSAWTSFTLSGAAYGTSTVWLTGTATKTLPNFGVGEHYIIIYSCKYITASASWDCYGNRWQLIVVNNTPTPVPPAVSCGDGKCNGDESCSNCSKDCGTCSTGNYFYISPSGSDSAAGSSSAPWKTLAKACSTVKTSGAVIHVNSGKYTETSACNLTAGVSIEGDGVSSIIKSHITGEFNYLIYLSSGSEGTNGNQHISGVFFDGDNLMGSNAIIVNARSNVKIYSCTFQNFEVSGVVFNGGTGYIEHAPGIFGTGNEFHDNTLTNCAYYVAANDFGSGNLLIGGQSGMLIYNNVITQTARGKGLNGYCIKHYSGGYNKGIKLYNNVLTTAPAAGPEPAYSWGFVLEQWNMLGGWEIYGNTIHGCLDLVHAVKGSYSFACDIHNNTIGFDVQNPALDTEGDVGIRLESNFDGVNIHNNHFKNMAMGIFATGISGRTMKDLNVNYNLFTNLGTADLNDRGMAFRYLSDGSSLTITNWNILNNVITAGTIHSTAYGVQLPYGAVSNINIRNNIITGFSWAAVGEGASNTGTNSGVSIENNLFYSNGNNNVPTYYGSATVQNNIVGNPLFVSSTDFHLQKSSPAIDKGINVGLTKDFDGKSIVGLPDIGAFER